MCLLTFDSLSDVSHFRSATELLLSRVISGLGVGIAFAVCPIYMGEIAEEKVRGILGRSRILSNNVSLAGNRVLKFI